ncbi:transmembrane protein, putative [Medicago truncatula]|uniref:Transmembrane protein, putative n=1 Tax=Medicago truncatula TaxID=3880 RepID=A0A072V7Q1_MEDTR|nr:transmembrane protein, putative [Medicago truncatula]
MSKLLRAIIFSSPRRVPCPPWRVAFFLNSPSENIVVHIIQVVAVNVVMMQVVIVVVIAVVDRVYNCIVFQNIIVHIIQVVAVNVVMIQVVIVDVIAVVDC